MSNSPSSDSDPAADLAARLASLEMLRDTLDPAVYEATRQRLEAAAAEVSPPAARIGGGLFAGEVTTSGGPLAGRDQRVAAVSGNGDHRTVIVNTGDGVQIAVPTAEAPETTLLQAYLRDLADDCARLPLGHVDPRFSRPGAEVALPGVYTDLHVVAVPPEPVGAEDAEPDRVWRRGLRLARAEEGTRTDLLPAVGGEHGDRLVLVGDAGSGKSTFVDYLAYRLAQALVDSSDDAGVEDLPEAMHGLVPVRIQLRRAAVPTRAPRCCGTGCAPTSWSGSARSVQSACSRGFKTASSPTAPWYCSTASTRSRRRASGGAPCSTL
ncbi:hypothetical protein [Thioflavicoccus mobilis]|uniref:hypothetical protein n=1 Tax=Thioflavicoccus mobilis TaxID=80679 RepID=UPI0003083494|nr:hypothetical protein [Thioflavicoccus mobilis]